MTWADTETKARSQDESEELPRSYEENERRRVHQESSGFLGFISIILFVHFLLLNTYFPILNGLTHVSFWALYFHYFKPLFNGNTSYLSQIRLGRLRFFFREVSESIVILC